MGRRHVGVCAACGEAKRIEARGLCHRDYTAVRRAGMLDQYPPTGRTCLRVDEQTGEGIVVPTSTQLKIEQAIARAGGNLRAAADLCREDLDLVTVVWQGMEAAVAS